MKVRSITRVLGFALLSLCMFALPIVPFGDIVAGQGPAQHAANFVDEAVDSIGLGIDTADAKERKCGLVTCTDYWTLAETKAKHRQLRRAGIRVSSIIDGTCTVVGIIFALVHPAAGAVAELSCATIKIRLASQVKTVKKAARAGQCFQISFARYGSNNPMFATGWGMTDNPTYCQ